MNRAEIHTTLS